MRWAFAAALALCAAPGAFAKDASDQQQPSMQEQSSTQQPGDVRSQLQQRAHEYDQAWGDPQKMATFWTTDAVIVDPMGKTAVGRTAIRKNITEDMNGMFRGTTSRFTLKRIRQLSPNLALVDYEDTVSGMKGPDGQAMPDQKFHATVLAVRQGNQWLGEEARFFKSIPAPQQGVGGAGTQGQGQDQSPGQDQGPETPQQY